ncbi:MAG: hypothetical protein Q9184_005960 [Pyrenodesmia sp. 2 TL-2023]
MIIVTAITTPEREQITLIRSPHFQYRFPAPQSFEAFAASTGETPCGAASSGCRALQEPLLWEKYTSAQAQKRLANDVEYLRFSNDLKQIKCLHARLHYHSPIILDEAETENPMQELWEGQVTMVRVKVEGLIDELDRLGSNRGMRVRGTRISTFHLDK